MDALSKSIADEGGEEEATAGGEIGRAERKLRQGIRAVALMNLQVGF